MSITGHIAIVFFLFWYLCMIGINDKTHEIEGIAKNTTILLHELQKENDK